MADQELETLREALRRARSEADEWAEAIRSVAFGAIVSPSAARAAIAELFEKWQSALAARNEAEQRLASALDDIAELRATLRQSVPHERVCVQLDPGTTECSPYCPFCFPHGAR
jgi:DNA repair exonuclease SbcCD ATPase subunit